MADQEDVNALRRRGRRRLVGAIALVLVAVIVLPMVFDSEPRQSPPVSVRIPGEDESAFSPKVTPKGPAETRPQPPAPAPEAPKSEPAPAKAEPAAGQAKEVRAAQSAAEKTQVAAGAKPAPKPPGVSTAPSSSYMVPVGAYHDPSRVIEQLRQAGIPHYTEPVATAKGEVTRVRAGPYPTETAALKALEQLQALGLKPGKVAPRE